MVRTSPSGSMASAKQTSISPLVIPDCGVMEMDEKEGAVLSTTTVPWVSMVSTPSVSDAIQMMVSLG